MSCFLCTHKPDPEFPKLNCNERSELGWVSRRQLRGSAGASAFVSGDSGRGRGAQEGGGMRVIGMTKPRMAPRAGCCHHTLLVAPAPLSCIPTRTSASWENTRKVSKCFLPSGNGKKVNVFCAIELLFYFSANI